MDIVKIVVIALVFAVIIVYLQSVNREIALVAAIVAGTIIIMSVLDLLGEVFSLYQEIASLGEIGNDVLKLIIKITLICYIVEFAVGVIEDFGLKSLADKVTLAGKLIVIVLATPIIISLIKTIKDLVV